MYECFHCLYHNLKVFFTEKQYFFADLPPNSVFPNLTLDARSSVIYNLYGFNNPPSSPTLPLMCTSAWKHSIIKDYQYHVLPQPRTQALLNREKYG